MIFKAIDIYALRIPVSIRWYLTLFILMAITGFWYFFIYRHLHHDLGVLQQNHAISSGFNHHEHTELDITRFKKARSYHDFLKDISAQGIIIQKSSIEHSTYELYEKSVMSLSLHGRFHDFYRAIEHCASHYLCMIDSIECTAHADNLLSVVAQIACVKSI